MRGGEQEKRWIRIGVAGGLLILLPLLFFLFSVLSPVSSPEPSGTLAPAGNEQLFSEALSEFSPLRSSLRNNNNPPRPLRKYQLPEGRYPILPVVLVFIGAHASVPDRWKTAFLFEKLLKHALTARAGPVSV